MEAPGDKPPCDLVRLARAMLEQQPAVTGEMPRCGFDDGLQRRHAVTARGERRLRLALQGRMRQRGVVPGDIGRVADDRVEMAPGERRKPAAVQQFDMHQSKRQGIGARDRQRWRGGIGGGDLPLRPFGGQRQRNGAGSRSQVHYSCRGVIDARQRSFHQQLSFWPRHQHGSGDGEPQGPEILESYNVGQGLTGGAPLDPVAIGEGGGRILSMGQEPGPADSERLRQQELRIEPGALADEREPLRPLPQQHADCVIGRHSSYYPGMSQPLYPPSSPQPIGQVLDTAFRLFQVSLVKCLPYGLLTMMAGQLASIYSLAAGKPIARFGGGDPLWWVLYAVGVLASLFLWSAMLLRQVGVVTQKPTRLGEELLAALRRMPALVVLAILGTLAVAVGLVLLVIPGLYLTTALIPAWPAVVLERRGPLAAMRYSLQLTLGHWWRMSLVLTVAFVVTAVFYIAVFVLLGMVLPLVGANDVAMFTASSVIVVVALGALGAPFWGAIVLAMGGDLKLRREGLDLEQRLAAAARD